MQTNNRPLAYNELMSRFYGGGTGVCRNVTFCVTGACDLRCKYCFVLHKQNKYMTFDTAKKIVDLLFRMSETDESNLINTHTKSLILEFIGGEPLLNIDVIAKTCDYFWSTALAKRHVWADTFRISIISNGVNYFDESVQNFLKKYNGRISFAISIDGDKEMHDSCRVHPDGRGSWEEATAAQTHYHNTFGEELHTKCTISPENLPYLDKTIRYFVENGYKIIHANTVYEADWSIEDAKLYYRKLKDIADYLKDYPEVFCSLFEENFFRPLPETENRNFCGGVGEMLAFGTDGTAYPCVRYMDMSLNGSQPEIRIGNCDRGIYSTAEEKAIRDDMESVTRRSQSTDECFYCPIAAGCSWCSAWNYQKHSSYNKRDTASCIMHKARSLANVYYFNKIRGEKFPMYLDEQDAISIVGEEEYGMLLELTNNEE